MEFKKRILFYVKIAIAFALSEVLAQVIWHEDGALHVDLYHGDEILAVSTSSSTVFYDRDLKRIGRRTLCVTTWDICPASSPNARYFVSRDGVVYDDHLASAGRYANSCMRIVIASGHNDSRDKLVSMYSGRYICFDLGSQTDITEQVPFLADILSTFRPDNIPGTAARGFLNDNSYDLDGTHSGIGGNEAMVYQNGKKHVLKDSHWRKAKIVDGKVYYADYSTRELLVLANGKIEKVLESDEQFSDWDVSRFGDVFLAKGGKVERYVVSDGEYKLEKVLSRRSVIGVFASCGLFRMFSQLSTSIFRSEVVSGSDLLETGLEARTHLLK